MKLKTYQKEVLADLKNYLEHLRKSNDLREAFRQHWLDRSIDPHTKNNDLLHAYNNSLAPGIPNVTLKVPTAGGKTYIAANALPVIFDYLPQEQPHVVAWFVPSDSIREQTLRNLQTPGHPYYEALQGYCGNLVVEGKEEALMGTGLSPTAVNDQLTVLVLSAQSFATKERDDLLSWRQNAFFAQWDGHYHYSTEQRIEGADELSLIQWLAWQRPICVVDESHNFGSDMRTEMLRLLNPSFILNLTATPKPDANIVSFVDAGKLKKESMVKLPVVLYNMETVDDVIANAILWQKTLERHAIQAQKQNNGHYIRPIVLLQVEPRTGQENANYELVMQTLLDNNIPRDQIKYKLADPLNELKNIDLLASDCPVRYIITVNALKEGWDCPFAYILAALSNRTSPIDVEQVLGRILRQPNARRSSDPLLNESYVLTSKQDFHDAAEAVIRSLQKSGFSRRDYRLAKTEQPKVKTEDPKPDPSVPEPSLFGNVGDALNTTSEGVAARLAAASVADGTFEEIAIQQGEQYNEETNQQTGNNDLKSMINTYPMRQDVSEVAKAIRIPLFSIENKNINDLMPEPHILLTEEKLNKGFNLLEQDSKVSLIDSQSGVVSIDLKDSGDGQYTPKRTTVNESVLNSLRQTFASFSPEMKRTQLTEIIVEKLRYNSIQRNDLVEYVKRALAKYNGEQLSDFYLTAKKTAEVFKEKIDDLLEIYRFEQLKRWLSAHHVQMNCYWEFPLEQNVASIWDSVDKSLYIAEEHASTFEEGIIARIAEEDNVLFWHRNTQNKRDTFTINGFIRHQPDFIVVLKSGDVLLIETKGKHLLNEDSNRKAELGRMWEEHANRNGGKFHYYMVYQAEYGADNAVSVAELIEQIRLFK